MVDTREIAAEYRLSHWAGIMRERSASGMSIKTYCESIGIRENVYHYWKRKLREAAYQEVLSVADSQEQKGLTPNGWAVCSTTENAMKDNTVIIEIGKSRVMAAANSDIALLTKVCRMLMTL